MKKLHFHTGLSEKIGFLFEEQQCKDIYMDRITDDARLGSIYLGKVRNLDLSIAAAFIDIGLKKVGFLPLSEIPFPEKGDSSLTDGARILVQVAKEPYQDKGPRLTANITITAKNIIYLPYGSYIVSSRKLSDDVSNKWKQMLKEKLSDKEGLILRTDSEATSEEEMDQDLEKTRLQWRQLKELSIKKKAPYLLFQHPLVPDQMLNHYQSFDFSDITFDNRKTLNDMQLAFPRLANKMRIRKETNKIAGKEIQQWLIEAIESVVHKQDGITLTIEQTEALTVIDIDSNKFTSRQNKQETMYRINQKALKYCLEEIQKRNLSGIILIDFLKMRKAEEAALLKQMQVTVKEDPLPTQVFGFTRLGLMELTRKRERTGLIQLLTNHSASARLPLSAETIAYQLERELISWNDGNIESMIILCHEEVVAFFNRFIKQHVKTKIHFTLYCQTDNKSCEFQVIRAGSDDLIEEYIKQHQEIAVDRML